jgi:hypothetical protein
MRQVEHVAATIRRRLAALSSLYNSIVLGAAREATDQGFRLPRTPE